MYRVKFTELNLSKKENNVYNFLVHTYTSKYTYISLVMEKELELEDGNGKRIKPKQKYLFTVQI